MSTGNKVGKRAEPASESVLQEAERIINGERRADYGDVRESFQVIADLWAPVLRTAVTAEEVALCMIQLKVARALNGYQRDSIVDIAGYAGCLAHLRGLDHVTTDELGSSPASKPSSPGPESRSERSPNAT